MKAQSALVLAFLLLSQPTAGTGDRIAFSCVPERKDDAELYLILGDGTGLQRLTYNAVAELSPVWSPDGERLVFQSAYWYQPTNVDVVVSMNILDVSVLVPQVIIDGHRSSPTWSPDGQWIAFVTGPLESPPLSILKIRQDGSQPTSIIQGMEAANLAWSPDGAWIAFVSGGYRIFRIRPDGTELKEITQSDSLILSLKWAPDSHEIAYQTLSALHVTDTEGIADHVVVSNLSRGYTWSSEGDLAYVTSSPVGQILSFIDHQGSVHTVLNNHSGEISWPMWSSNSRHIYYLQSNVGANSQDETHVQLHRSDTNGSNTVQVTDLDCGVSTPSLSAFRALLGQTDGPVPSPPDD